MMKNFYQKSGLKLAFGILLVAFGMCTAANSFAQQNSMAIGNVIFGQAFVGQTTSPSTTPHLLHVSETLNPGDTLTLLGSLYPSATVYLQPVTGGSAPISLNVLSATYNVVQAQIPSDIPFGMWEVWVEANGNASNQMLVNQARGVRFSYDQVAPGGPFTIFGRNLVEPNYNPEVSFVDGVGVSHMAENVSGNLYQLSATAPADLVPGASYTVHVANGMGGYSQGMFNQVLDSLTVRTGGVDAFNLGVPWAADFTFYNNVYNVKTDTRLTTHAVADGVTDDQPAIQGALLAATRASIAGVNGGVVYLPAGTYLISQNLQLFSNVVLEGAGPNATTIIYDTGTSSSIFAYTQGSSTFGIMNLSIINPAANYNKYIAPSQVGSLSIENYSGNPQSEFFLDNVNFSYTDGNGNQIIIGSYDKVLIENSTFNSTGGSFFMNNDSHVTFLNNTSTYHFGRVDLAYSDYPLFEGNNFILNEAFLTTSTESGGIQVSWSKMPVILNNTIEDSGNNATSGMNFGESINTQDSDGRIFRDVGTVAGVSASGGQTVTLSSSTNTPLPVSFPIATSNEPEVIQILDGPALGQWRAIVSNTSTSVMVDTPWEIIPPVGSHYSLGMWSANNLYVLGNTFNNTIKAIEVYQGGIGTVIANNTMTNAQGIFVAGTTQTNVTNYGTWSTPLPITLVDPLWDTYIDGNTITNLNNDPVKGKAYLAVDFAQVNPEIWGNEILNTEVRDNSIICEITCSGATSYSQADWVSWGNTGSWNGFQNIHPGGSYSALNYDIAGLLGSVFEKNSATGMTTGYYGFFESSDADQTIVDTTNMTIPPTAFYTLTVSTAGNGSGTVTGNGIDCGVNATACSEPLNIGAVVNLTATAANGSVFSGWSGGGCSGTATTCVTSMYGNQTATATFTSSPVNGVCGAADQTYLYATTSFGSNAFAKQELQIPLQWCFQRLVL